ncbi:5-methyltetrahydropteroyltriglutamate--homocysteine methyltransferase [Tanacetum coccineum]
MDGSNPIDLDVLRNQSSMVMLETCHQISLAIKDEVEDLEKAGIRVIQIDEAALREGLLHKKAEHVVVTTMHSGDGIYVGSRTYMGRSSLLRTLLYHKVVQLQEELDIMFLSLESQRFETCHQIALAIKDEVEDLEKAGIRVIQIDNDALREGLLHKKAEHAFYLEWVVQYFRITSVGVADITQPPRYMGRSSSLRTLLVKTLAEGLR